MILKPIRKVRAYCRVATEEQVEIGNYQLGERNAWILERRDNEHESDELLDLQLEAFCKKCKEAGYDIVGKTIFHGSSELTVPFIRYILDRGKRVDYIMSRNTTCLSCDVDEALAIIDYLLHRGILFKSIENGELVLPRHDMIIASMRKEEVKGNRKDNNELEETKLSSNEMN